MTASIIILGLSACRDFDTETTTTHAETTRTTTNPMTTSTTSWTTTSISTSAYDDRGLVPEDCEHLDNIDEWQPVWCDEFDTDGLPSDDHWFYDVGGGGWGNNESQYYTQADLDNARVEDGHLYITAIKEDFQGYDYTSARLITKYRGDWQYGRIKIRAKMPSGRGLWSALWMLPTDWEYGGWPSSGEIDIMEYVGYDQNTVYGTIHTEAYNHGLGTQIGFDTDIEGVETEFHVYEMVWEPRKINLYIDGNLFAYFGYNPNSNVDVPNYAAWPFDQRFHLIMNIAVGGSWGGAQGIDDTVFPQSMVVDYVRVYQKDYAGMDVSAPSEVSDVTLQDNTFSSLKIKWEDATDDVMVKGYDIFVDGDLYDTTTLNAILIEGLQPGTTYDIGVVAKDFNDQRSDMINASFTTDPVPLATDRMEAEYYMSSEGIDTEVTSDVSGNLNVGWIDDGDQMTYILEIPETGDYKIRYRVASPDGGGEIKMYGSSLLPLTTTSIGATGGWQTWEDVTSDVFTIQEGVYTFTLKASKGGFNLNYFIFEKVDE